MTETIFSIAVIAITILLITYKYWPQKSKRRKDKESTYLGIWWFFIFISGSVLYFISFSHIQQLENQSVISYWLYTVTISARTSIKMFSFDLNYELVRKIADINVIYCAAIIINFISACLWTTILVKEIFLKKIVNEIKVWLYARKKNECHYIIIGCEKSMKVLLSDLTKTMKKNNITIITGEVKDGNDHFNEFLEERYAVIKGKADEAALEKAGIDNTKSKTRVIAITEYDEQNLAVADIVTQKIHSKVEPDNIETSLKNINLEAYIMYSFIERTEHFAFAEEAYGKVDFFNPYELRVRDFFWKNPITSLIPHLIDTEKARLKGDFKSDGKIYKQDGQEYLIKNIFVGFGWANYQMLKGSILTGQLLGCDYNAIIYDENPSTMQAMFMNHSSGLFPGGDQTIKGEEYFDSPKEKYKINFKRYNILTKEFYAENENGLINEVENNDFTAIYIALGDDKLSVETACEIRQCLYEYGITQDKVSIFVKVCEESVFNKDSVINSSQNIPIKIKCFGLNNSILTKEHILNESLDKFARAVTNKNHEISWERLAETKRDINRQVAMAIKTKLNLLGFDLIDGKESEKDTKDYKAVYYKNIEDDNDDISKIIKLSEKIAENNNEGIESAEEKNERLGFILDYVETEKDNKNLISDTPRNNLARLEHLRWNTFHLIHGWTKQPKSKVSAKDRQNKFTKQHACITTFEGLIELRELQAKKICEKDPNIPYEKALAKADTIWYDFNLMDELVERLRASDKSIYRLG